MTDNHMTDFDRAMKVTASVVAAIVRAEGETRSRKWAWRVITGREPEVEVGPDIQRGLDHEDDAICGAEIELGRLAYPGRFVLHPTIPWLGASPDGFLDEGTMIPMEAKCPRVLHQVFPPKYVPQVQTQLECCDAPYGYFISWVGDAQRVMKVERDRAWWATNFPIIEQFYLDYVLKDVEPPKSPRRSKNG